MLWLGLLSMPAAVKAQGFSTTMLRFGCSQLSIDRIDPYVGRVWRGREAGGADGWMVMMVSLGLTLHRGPVSLSPATFRPRTSTRSSAAYVQSPFPLPPKQAKHL